jgi:predicted RNase H-like nuclease (RuvC/YqgF family)
VSDAAEEEPVAPVPPALDRLGAVVEDALVALESWRRRAEQAESEVTRLREALEAAAADVPAPVDAARQIRRLRAENTALRTRMAQAQRRIEALLGWTDVLEEPE